MSARPAPARSFEPAAAAGVTMTAIVAATTASAAPARRTAWIVSFRAVAGAIRRLRHLARAADTRADSVPHGSQSKGAVSMRRQAAVALVTLGVFGGATAVSHGGEAT